LTLIAVSVSRQRREIGFAQSSAKRSQNALFSFFQDSSRRLANIFSLLAKVLRRLTVRNKSNWQASALIVFQSG
jgi:hypothetical protein